MNNVWVKASERKPPIGWVFLNDKGFKYVFWYSNETFWNNAKKDYPMEVSTNYVWLDESEQPIEDVKGIFADIEAGIKQGCSIKGWDANKETIYQKAMKALRKLKEYEPVEDVGEDAGIILDRYYEPKMHWNLYNRPRVIRAMNEFKNKDQKKPIK